MRVRRAVLGCAALLLTARAAHAHHSFAAVYDGEKPVTLSGTVTDVEWTNPHIHISMNVTGDDGTVTEWRFEGYPPNMLVRQGWRRDETLMPGATVTVEGWASRDDATLGAVRWVTFADGRKLAGGPPAGTGGR